SSRSERNKVAHGVSRGSQFSKLNSPVGAALPAAVYNVSHFMNVIHVENLVKKFGQITAVDNIHLDVEPGQIFGFLGPNGAGKSTTIKILATLLRPTAGSASVAGYDVATKPNDVRRNIGLVFQDQSLDD